MKKSILASLVLIAIALLISGCGNSGVKTCTLSKTDSEGYKIENTMIITYKNTKVTSVEETSISEMNPEYVAMSVAFGQIAVEALSDVEGMELSIEKDGDNKVKTYTKVDFTKIDLEKLKEKMDDPDSTVMYENLDITVDEFIEKNASEYTCK